MALYPLPGRQHRVVRPPQRARRVHQPRRARRARRARSRAGGDASGAEPTRKIRSSCRRGRAATTDQASGPLSRTCSTRAMAARNSTQPIVLVLAYEPNTPRQRLAAGARHAGVDQGIEHDAFAHAQARHHRNTLGREEILETATRHAPRHLAAPEQLGLVGDRHAVVAGVVTELLDPLGALQSMRRVVVRLGTWCGRGVTRALRRPRSPRDRPRHEGRRTTARAAVQRTTTARRRASRPDESRHPPWHGGRGHGSRSRGGARRQEGTRAAALVSRLRHGLASAIADA